MTEHAKFSVDLSGTAVGRFQVRSRLGAGGMGEVYLAEDTQLKRLVALKRIAPHLSADKHFRQRFLHEARISSQLNDAHIAGIYDVFERNGDIFLVMEYVEGKPLRQFLNTQMNADGLLPIAIECAHGLAAAHAQGVLHRDIKPENIMITNAGHVKILDFGLARKLEYLEETVSYHTEQGVHAGTAGYIAPEVLQDAEPDTRSDIFALGVVFYEALSGHHPFRGKNPLGTAHRVVNTIPPPLGTTNPSVSPELERVVAKMLAKDPAQRYPTATELATELDRIARGIPEKHAAEPAARPLDSGWRLRLLRAGLVLLLVLSGMSAVRPVRDTVGRWLGFSQFQGPKLVVVLPFTALGGDASDKAFAVGLTDTVTAQLGELSAAHDLEVVPASDVFEKNVTTPDMARKEFGATLALTGSLQKAGDQVRVNCSLIDTKTRRQLDAQTITVAAADPFAVEDDVSTRSLGMLQVQLNAGEKKSLGQHGTENSVAYAFYLRGMGYLKNYDRSENIASAIDEFQHALDQDPNYARAFAGLGQAYWERYRATNDVKWAEESTKACQRAASLNSELASAMTCLGTVAAGTGHYQKAAEQFQKALEADPTNDRAYFGLAEAYAGLGNTAGAENTYQKEISRRPEYWAGYSKLGAFYFQEGRYADARQMFEKVIALVPDNDLGYSNLGAMYIQEGKFAEAVPVLERSVSILPTGAGYTNLGTAYFFLHKYGEAVRNFRQSVVLEPNSKLNWRNLGDGYYWAPGQRGQATAAYGKAIELAQEALKVNSHDAHTYGTMAVCQAMVGENDAALQALKLAQKYAHENPGISYDAALVYARIGNREKAMKWLKAALRGGVRTSYVRNDPGLDSLHGMKGFPGPERGHGQ